MMECQQDVGGFDVAVMDLACMSIGDRAGERADDPGYSLGIGTPHREGTPPRVAVEGLCVGRNRRRDDIPEDPRRAGPRRGVDPADHLIERQPGTVGHDQAAEPGLGLKDHAVHRDDMLVIEPPHDRRLLTAIG